MTQRLVLFIGSNDSAALYTDGVIDRYGPTDAIQERALELAGVTLHFNDDFMCGGDHRGSTAPRLADVTEFQRQREENRAKAAVLRAEADALRRQADKLDGGTADDTALPRAETF